MQASVDCYDCEAVPTSIIEGGKQEEIDQRVRECDWFILVANTVTCGKYTAQEWDAALNSIRGNRANKVVTVFRCVNPDASSSVQKIPEDGLFKFNDLFLKAEETGLGVQFLVDYTYRRDGLFESLKYVVSRQIELVMNSDLLMKTISSPISQITARDIYANSYRVDPEYGFDEDVYLKRQTVDGELAIKSKSHKFIIITGSPASGKTRAIYEYLKLLRSNPANRYVVVNEFNLEEIAETLKSFDKWARSTPGARSAHLDQYYFIIDQIGDVLYREENQKWFSDMYNVVVQYNGHIFATSLIEPYENLKKDQILPEETIKIQIKKLDETTDSEFNEELQQRYGDDENWGAGTHQVIGDYIRGLRRYKDSISDLVKKSGQRKDIEAFIKAFNIINLFRKGNVWPLGLVLSVAEKIADKQYSQAELRKLLDFFQDNNILHEYPSRPPRTWAIKRDEKYDYDGEKLSMLIPPRILIKIDNDYIWQYLRTEMYPLDCSDQDEMESCMNWYCEAFFHDVPIPTLKRIITRSPAQVYALKYNAGANFVRDFVIDRIYQMYEDGTEYSKEEMGEMIAYVLHRSSSIDELKQDYDAFVNEMGGDFALNEKIVAELMGFALHKTHAMKKLLKEFLNKKGWDFSRKRISFYYHRRMIQYLDKFKEVEEYMNDNVLLDTVLTGQVERSDEMIESNKRLLICAAVKKCKHVSNVKKVFEWAKQLKFQPDKLFLLSLSDAVRKSKFLHGKENLAMLECVCDNMIPTEQLPCELICYHVLKMSSSFANALPIYKRYEENLAKLPAMQDRCMSAMMESVKRYEFSVVYRFLFNGGKLQYPLHNISRNLLLERLDFNSAMVLYERLFDSSDENSTPDIFTLCSLLKVNIDNLKTAGYKRINKDKHIKDRKHLSPNECFVYQNLLQILHHPYTKKINELELVLPQILLCCLTQKQEDSVVKNYIKPAYLKLNRAKTSGLLTEVQQAQRADAFWENKLLTAEVAVPRIKRRMWVDMNEVYSYLVSVVDGMFAASKPVPSDVLNCYMNKIFSFNQVEHPEYEKSQEDLIEYRSRLNSYLEQTFRLPQTGVSVSKLDRMIKDEYFYPAYYRIFPEKIVVKEQDKFVIKKEVLYTIPRDFLNNKLYSHILEGVAYFMGEEALSDIIDWICNGAENVSVYRPTVDFLAKAYPEKNFSGLRKISEHENERKIEEVLENENDRSWKFLNDFNLKYEQKPKSVVDSVIDFHELLPKIRSMKEKYPDSVPNYITLHSILKPKGQKKGDDTKWTLINSAQAIDLLKIVFLEHNLPVTPTFWKSVLECISHNVKHSFDRGDKEWFANKIDELYREYPHLIIDDQTTLAYRLNVTIRFKKFFILKSILDAQKFMTVLDLSLIIQHNDLFDKRHRMYDYISLMKRYHSLQQSLVDEKVEHGNTYGHFLTGCANNYHLMEHRNQKEFLYQMSKFVKIDNDFRDILSRIEEKYDSMVDDLEETLGVDVSHLRALKGGLPAEPNSGV